MEFVVLWILFGVVSAVVGSKKGRSGCGWFTIGFLLGPIGLILAFVVSPDQRAVDKAALQSGTMKKCPFCAELVRVEAIKCRHCGADLT
jgi:hypothetical protein